jgi:hypothetical protein
MRCGRACGARQGHGGGAGIIRGAEQFKFPPLPGDRHPSPVTRRQICHRTVADRPGNLSEVLTGHCRRAHPETPGPPFPEADRGDPQRRPQTPPRACPPGTNSPQGMTGRRQRSQNVADP